MLSNENVTHRAKMACASDIPAILNRSPFRDATRDGITAKKLQVIRDPETRQKSKPSFMRGNYLEESVARLCVDTEFGVGRFVPRAPSQCLLPNKFIYGNTMFHRDLPRYGATLDFLTCIDSGEDAELRTPILPIEVKTSNHWDGWTSGKVPDHVWIQVQWQLFVLRSWDIPATECLVAALICSDEVRRWVGYDEGFIRSILPSVDRWLADLAKHEVDGTGPEPPAPIVKSVIPPTPTSQALVRELVGVKLELRDLEAEYERIATALLDDVPAEVYGSLQTENAWVNVCKRDTTPKPSSSDLIAALRKALLLRGVTESEIESICDIPPTKKARGGSRYLHVKSKSLPRN